MEGKSEDETKNGKRANSEETQEDSPKRLAFADSLHDLVSLQCENVVSTTLRSQSLSCVTLLW